MSIGESVDRVCRSAHRVCAYTSVPSHTNCLVRSSTFAFSLTFLRPRVHRTVSRGLSAPSTFNTRCAFKHASISQNLCARHASDSQPETSSPRCSNGMGATPCRLQRKRVQHNATRGEEDSEIDRSHDQSSGKSRALKIARSRERQRGGAVKVYCIKLNAFDGRRPCGDHWQALS